MKSSFKYYLFNKPYGVICQFSPEGDKPTLAQYLPVEKDVYPVGRLDTDSEGLLLLTNDKSLNKKLLDPGAGHTRSYFVQVDGDITQEALERLAKGVEINVDGKTHLTRKAKAEFIEEPEWLWERNPPVRFRKTVPTSWIKLTLTEGKNRQVRKMTAAVGFPTLRLIRFSIGKLTVKGLMPGDYALAKLHEIIQ